MNNYNKRQREPLKTRVGDIEQRNLEHFKDWAVAVLVFAALVGGVISILYFATNP